MSLFSSGTGSIRWDAPVRAYGWLLASAPSAVACPTIPQLRRA